MRVRIAFETVDHAISDHTARDEVLVEEGVQEIALLPCSKLDGQRYLELPCEL